MEYRVELKEESEKCLGLWGGGTESASCDAHQKGTKGEGRTTTRAGRCTKGEGARDRQMRWGGGGEELSSQTHSREPGKGRTEVYHTQGASG